MPDALRSFLHLIVTKLQFAHEGEAADLHAAIDRDFAEEAKIEGVVQPIVAGVDPAAAAVIADLQAKVDSLVAAQVTPTPVTVDAQITALQDQVAKLQKAATTTPVTTPVVTTPVQTIVTNPPATHTPAPASSIFGVAGDV